MALLGLTLALVTVNAGQASGRGGDAVVAKKKCKKKGKKPAAAAKKKKCKKKKQPVTPPVPTPPATPQALTDSEVIQRIIQKAGEYCAADAAGTGEVCTDSGYYVADMGSNAPACETKSTYAWSCYGWYDFDAGGDPEFPGTCDFREVVERDGINGIKSHLDTTFEDGGFLCTVIL